MTFFCTKETEGISKHILMMLQTFIEKTQMSSHIYRLLANIMARLCVYNCMYKTQH